MTGIGSVKLDITDVRDVEQRLEAVERTMRDSQTRMQALLDHAPMSILLSDGDGRYVVANGVSADQVGRPVEEILGRTPAELYEPAMASRIEQEERPVREGAGPVTFEMTVPGRGARPEDAHDYLITKYPVTDADGQIIGIGTLSLDITERKRAEANAARSAEIVKSTDAAVVGMALDGQILSWNPAAERIYGYTAAEAVGCNVSLLIPPERRDEVRSNKGRINGGHGVGEIETVRRRKDGIDIDVAVALSPLHDPAGAVIGASTIARDITAQLAVREELRASEERFRTTIDHAPIGIALRAGDGRALRVNRALCVMLGYEERELLARSGREITHPDDFGVEAELTRRLLAGEVPGGETEKRYIRADGSVLFAQLSMSVARDRDGQPMHVVSQIQNITARKENEARLRMHGREQEALTAVATLVASEAHPRAVFGAAAERVAGLLDADFGIVVRLEPGGTPQIVGGWAADHLPPPPLGVLLDRDGPTATALRTGRTATLGRDALDPGVGTVAASRGLAEPIEINGKLWGAVSVGWETEPAPDPNAADRLARFAHLVSLAVTGAEAREQLCTAAFTDHLTGLYNLRAFSDRLDEEVARSRRHGRPVSLAVFDLDHFKLVNDTLGHQMGDRVLAEFAGRLMTQRREGDVIARVGGEEFAWILPDTDGPGAQAAAERARRAIADTPFPGVGRKTTSIGICTLRDAQDARELFRHADLALYWAKTNGRNATLLYSPETLALPTADDQAHMVEDAKTLAAIRALAAAVDAKDPSTQRHSERVADLASNLARVAGWDTGRIALLRDAALVHDVGKIGVPDQILLKPGKLSVAEYEQVKTHAALGVQMLADLLSPEQIDWIRHHHERFDGAGYPDRLAGTEIAEGARLLALADAWDAMTVARPYGTPRTAGEALAECRRGAGTHFCPDAVAALLRLQD
jgi:diguanylate cyclase (GGDEF)-like protein/PAS domain S-box-containing protein